MHRDSPEDRLLHLIKRKSKKRDTKVLKNTFLKDKRFKASFLKPINRTLIITLIILLGYFIYNFLYPVQKEIGLLIEKREITPPVQPVETEGVISSSHIEDYSVYSKDIRGKELFSAQFVEEPQEPISTKIDVTKRFSLVGIIAGAEPQAIIEDKETQKTHYLYKGQSFNGITVVEIAGGKIVLNYKGKEITLVL